MRKYAYITEAKCTLFSPIFIERLFFLCRFRLFFTIFIVVLDKKNKPPGMTYFSVHKPKSKHFPTLECLEW